MAFCWTRHDDDAAGLSVQLPSGWRVAVATPAALSVSDAHGTAAALLRHRALPPRIALPDWLRRDYAATEPGLHNVRMRHAAGCGRHLAQAAFDYGGQLAQGRASVVALRRRGSVTLFIAAAAQADFGARLPLLARVLESMQFGGRVPAAGLDLLTLLRIGDAAD